MSRHFAIVGAGTAGLATAIGLCRAGHRVTVFEAFDDPEPVGAGLLIQPTGLRVLQQLNLLDDVLQRGRRIDRLVGQSPTGRRIMDVAYQQADEREEDATLRFGVGLHRATLFNTLYAEARRCGAECVLGFEVCAYEDTGSSVSVTDSEGRVETGFDGLVIANGAQSTLCDQMNIPHRCTPYPWGAVWTILPITAELDHPWLQQCYRGCSVMMGVLPSGLMPLTDEPCASFFWSLPLNEAEAWQKMPISEWKQQVCGFWPQLDEFLQPVRAHDDLSLARYFDVVMPHWHSGRVVIIGDAAHSMSPQLGQGANLALIDAEVLSRCVSETDSVNDAFAAYSSERHDHLRFYQQASRLLTPLFQSHSRVAGALRDLTFPLAQRIGWSRRQAMSLITGNRTGWLFSKPLRSPD